MVTTYSPHRFFKRNSKSYLLPVHILVAVLSKIDKAR
jgi:hypothetical protein